MLVELQCAVDTHVVAWTSVRRLIDIPRVAKTQIVLDWSIDGTGPDGKHVHRGGSASDILRRGADGLWRYIIDNNQGTAVRQAA